MVLERVPVSGVLEKSGMSLRKEGCTSGFRQERIFMRMKATTVLIGIFCFFLMAAVAGAAD